MSAEAGDCSLFLQFSTSCSNSNNQILQMRMDRKFVCGTAPFSSARTKILRTMNCTLRLPLSELLGCWEGRCQERMLLHSHFTVVRPSWNFHFLHRYSHLSQRFGMSLLSALPDGDQIELPNSMLLPGLCSASPLLLLQPGYTVTSHSHATFGMTNFSIVLSRVRNQSNGYNQQMETLHRK